MLLKDKTALITGASKGIGRAAALLFAKEGARVILLARSGNLLKELQSEIQQTSASEALVYEADVSVYADLKSVFDDLNSRKIYLDILVNNAGIMKDAVIQMVQQSLVQEIYGTNVFGTINTAQL